ncbi:hypothetical protein HJC23_014055 [Cyclotella cryptica]|uniref:Secondary thiamine-phosphate synthase enzyme n=1 Tax=Cyclotella cryptica TaxID=29204 RepID=A0ABD3QTA1_9STRA|eukprot:CCRYP_002453-RA/>CCRYP_002453-RA protein AED:0.04 eAED:0.03 QI:0/-1/0/1/-1/1/1/0/244
MNTRHISSLVFGMFLSSASAFAFHHLPLSSQKRQSHTVVSNHASSSASDTPLGKPICMYKTITIQPTGMNAGEQPRQAVSVEDLTPDILAFLSSSNMRNGVIHVISRHTTTAITINERESRLAQDVEKFVLRICPPDERSSSKDKVSGVRYLHNDIDQRPDGEEEAQRCRENGWDIDDPETLQKWRDQEPINAHSHLISMMLGSSECIPVVDGQMVIGQWQSILMVDLDGPRVRTVGLQLMGYE